MKNHAKILAVGTAVPPTSFTQQDLLQKLNIQDPHIIRLFNSTQIQKRHLFLPEDEDNLNESQELLIRKHLKGALFLSKQAVHNALEKSALKIEDIDFICVVSSTGFLLPSLSAHLIKELNMLDTIQRVDIVGMGCNGGLNGLNTASNWSLANPNKNALLVCVEICSAIYVNDNSLRAHVVNSLFGDGAAALVIRSGENPTNGLYPNIISFNSRIITDAIDAMRYDWDIEAKKFNFYLHHNNPYLVGRYVKEPVDGLLKQHQLKRSDISHWIVHGGGRNVISAVKMNLGISAHDMRHTTSVLREFGNISSGSFLFSYERLLQENIIQPGDYGLCLTIGPGAQLETALLQWNE